MHRTQICLCLAVQCIRVPREREREVHRQAKQVDIIHLHTVLVVHLDSVLLSPQACLYGRPWTREASGPAT